MYDEFIGSKLVIFSCYKLASPDVVCFDSFLVNILSHYMFK